MFKQYPCRTRRSDFIFPFEEEKRGRTHWVQPLYCSLGYLALGIEAKTPFITAIILAAPGAGNSTFQFSFLFMAYWYRICDQRWNGFFFQTQFFVEFFCFHFFLLSYGFVFLTPVKKTINKHQMADNKSIHHKEHVLTITRISFCFSRALSGVTKYWMLTAKCNPGKTAINRLHPLQIEVCNSLLV